MVTIQDLSETAAASFEDGQRENGTKFRRFATDIEANPIVAWSQDLSKAAHCDGDMWPDDHRFDMIEDALDTIAATDPDDDLDDGDISLEFATSAVSVSNPDRFAWLASHCMRAGYCDEALSEGLVTEDTDMTDRIAAGWYIEALEVFNQVLAFLTAKADELEDAA